MNGAGRYKLTISFAATTNYTTASKIVSLTVTQSTPTISGTAVMQTYGMAIGYKPDGGATQAVL